MRDFWWRRWGWTHQLPKAAKNKEKVDLRTGFDLTKVPDQRLVLSYSNEHKPFVVILSFGSWANLTRFLHPATWEETRRIGELLATFAARIVRLQIEANRHFVLENPAGSGLFHLECFKRVWESGKVMSINVPQCAFGLVVDGIPVRKDTTLWASNSLLLKLFLGVRCDHQKHRVLSGTTAGGVPRTRLAQVWRRQMCQRNCNGIMLLLRECRRAGRVHAADNFMSMYPTSPGTRPWGRPRKAPYGAEGRARGIIYDCPACFARLHKAHPSHTPGTMNLFCYVAFIMKNRRCGIATRV